jgi:hypothetical protein
MLVLLPERWDIVSAWAVAVWVASKFIRKFRNYYINKSVVV